MLSTASTEFKESVSKESCISALKQANEAVQKYGGARPGDRSMVCIDFLLHIKIKTDQTPYVKSFFSNL